MLRNLGAVPLLIVFSLSSFALQPSGRHFLDGSQVLRQRQKARGENPVLSASTQTVPYWSGSFTYKGLVFPFKMVGSDPKLGSHTTIVPAVLIPLRFVFSDGQVFDANIDQFDGKTAIQGILSSPIFQTYPFVINGTNVGTTQYGDAYQRANFWNSVSTRSPQYHVLLQPTVTASQTIVVPANMGAYGIDPASGIVVPYVDETFIGDQERTLRNALNISPKMLSIAVRGRVMAQSSDFPGEPSAIAWHGLEGTPQGLRTFIAASYSSAFFPDVYPLSHEVVEWLNDPFNDNYTPGWNLPFIEPVERCDSGSIAKGLLETADPVEFFPESIITLPAAFSYHVTEAMFLDYYTRQTPSRSVNGQYSLFTIAAPYGIPSEPSSPCVGSVQISRRVIDVPGAKQVAANGVNNQGDAVGYYVDAQNITHGFSKE